MRDLGQYGLAVDQPAQGSGIEAAERVKRAAFMVGAVYRGIQEIDVERRVMADQDRPFAVVAFNGGLIGVNNLFKASFSSIAMRNGW